MSRIVREILEQTKSGRNCKYTEVHVGLEELRQIFGPRVFDLVRKEWIEDDYDVIWVRDIGEKEAEQLKPHLGDIHIQFNFAANEYALITSEDIGGVA